jgi:hypothetical protein
MLNRLSILLCIISLVSCTNSDGNKEYGNLLGGMGRNNSFEYIEGFQYQIYSEILIDTNFGATCPPLLLSNNKTILASDSNTIISIFSNEKDWTFSLDSGSIIGAGFVSDANNNIYTIDNKGYTISLTQDGKLRFKEQFLTPHRLEFFNLPLYTENNIIFTTSDGNIVGLDTNGNENFSLSYDTDIIGEVSALSKKDLLVTLTNGTFGKTDTLVCLDNNGNEKWRFSSKGYRFLKGAITNGKNIAICGTKQVGDNKLSKLFYLDSEGSLLWNKEISSLPRFLSMSNNGELFVITFDSGFRKMLSGVFSYASEGELNWSIYYDYSIPTPAMISGNEIAFLASNRETYGLFFLNRADGVLIHSLDIGEAAPLDFLPAIGDEGTLNFAGKQHLRLIRIDETAINKILPY